AASGAAASMGSINEHIATGGEDCRYCPICQVISAVRETRPEVKQHFASAATSFAQAVAGILATQVPDQNRKTRSDSGVEKIDLNDGEDWEDDHWDWPIAQRPSSDLRNRTQGHPDT
ncbi:MAG: hypothetical protein ACRDXB_04975, partial [Actinomycetes bacterium]